MGLMSRQKGARNERLLVEHLKQAGYGALRVPLSGAMKGFKCDVIATKGGVEYTFELKVRASEYASIYHMYNTLKFQVGPLRLKDPSGKLLAISSDVGLIVEPSGYYAEPEECPALKRTIKKLFAMEKLLNGAQYLVIRGDRMGFLFIRYL